MGASTGRIELLLAMTKQLATVRRQVMGKVPELVAGSGYVPFVDHAIPPRCLLQELLLLPEVRAGKPMAKVPTRRALARTPFLG